MTSATMVPGKSKEAQRKHQARARARDMEIGPVANVRRRNRCLKDCEIFLRTYFSWIFYQDFTENRRKIVQSIIHAARYGGDQSVAAPRGEGKTRLAIFTLLWLALRGEVSFPLLISKNGPRASRELKNLKDALQESLGFAADFPEVMDPILGIGRWASNAKQQTVYGAYTNLEWSVEAIVLPTVPQATLLDRHPTWKSSRLVSCAAGQIIASLGIEGPIRGYTIRNQRPDVAVLDDIDDRESARSELQTATREQIIEEDVAGLGGPARAISRVMLCTLINRTCIAATYTSKEKPSWRGKRFKLVERFGEHEDLADEYIQLRRGRSNDDPDARQAFAFYSQNRKAIESGALLSNPHRFDSRELPDGKPAEVSAYQAALNVIADRGRDHFDTEYQNDPPEELGPVESGINVRMIQKKCNGYPRKLVPPDCPKITCGIDCGKMRLHFVVRAWRADATGFTINYGLWEVSGTKYGSDEGLDVALKKNILALLEELRADDYVTADNERRKIDRVLIDAGWRSEAVYSACREAGLSVDPVMGFGQSAGCVRAAWMTPERNTYKKSVGDNWSQSRATRLVAANADHWKAWEHDRWMTARDRPGTMTIYGEPHPQPDRLSEDEKAHHTYAKHICNEVEVEEPYQGTIRRKWKAKSNNTHHFDASYYSDVAASMEGIRLLESGGVTKPTGERKTLAQMAAGTK